MIIFIFRRLGFMALTMLGVSLLLFLLLVSLFVSGLIGLVRILARKE